MSINKIRRLSINEHFISLLMQSFVCGYKKPCKIKYLFIAIPLIFYFDSRDKIKNSNSRSNIESLFSSKVKMDEISISGKTRLSGFAERYNFFKPICKDSLIILFSENKICIKDLNIIIKKEVYYNNYKNNVREWLKCAHNLGVVFSKTSEDHLSFYLGVD